MTFRQPLLQLSLLSITSLFLFTPPAARAQATEPFLGQIMSVPYTFCPIGWTDTLGQLFTINQNIALFSLIGTTYGGDGVSTFALPYLPPRTLRDGSTIRFCIALEGVFPSRN